MDKTFTIETRLNAPVGSEIRTYLDDYVIFNSKIQRDMWHEMTSPNHKKLYPTKSKYLTHICNKYNVLKRTANSIYFDIAGKMSSYMELKKLEQRNLLQKVKAQEKKVKKIITAINKIKPKITNNQATEKQLDTYRKNKRKLYYAKNKLNRLRKKLSYLEYQIDNKIYSLGFGSKKMFKKQHFLKENNYKSFEKWKNDYRKSRDKYILYVGSNDESYGNQLLQMTYNSVSDTFNVKLRKEYNYCSNGKNYIKIEGLTFKYLHDELVGEIQKYDKSSNNITPKQPLTYRFIRRGKKWYLQVMFNIVTTKYVTRKDYGTIGLDYNNGFIEMAETDYNGNLCNLHHYPLKYHGTGNKAKSEIQETISQIVNYSVSKGKDIVIEDLRFAKAKAQVGKNKKYNQMIHMFDYNRYKTSMENACHRKEVVLIMVNPAYTSKIGKEKYCDSKKLTVHQAASYVIARKGQGFID